MTLSLARSYLTSDSVPIPLSGTAPSFLSVVSNVLMSAISLVSAYLDLLPISPDSRAFTISPKD